ncbi:MAG: DNA protecting protein DprA [Candidatus Fraserbacteria bacterium RBG_16_55_9]|uniref:DNA protecting protein DprA n=1 Tax=Fraserbacteria sp. (strain RBG_16_55_9) TaxID=1817864 RepID=A0A1F5V1D4_FRAXR|nr:MAG: DNA protecting protein DprA [Candidatus Fraserbacteria bacterium RBG_16_55_9]
MAVDQLQDKRYWIALNLIPNLTPKKFHLLLECFSSPQEIWQAPLAQLKEIAAFARSAETFVRHRERTDIDAELREIEARRLKVITLADADYPKALRAIDAAPPVLYLKGDYIEKDELAIAIVGTRRPSPYGTMISEKLGKELGALGFTIVSGLALGIDTAAHRGALAAGARTIAVLGGGFFSIYPQENRNLVEEIARCGSVMSEYSLKTPPDRWTFPRRNRIISGLTRGTIVVEAPKQSGALITAKFALDQGREVFAVPGPITEEASKGTHHLIQQGAKLVMDIDDILVEFADLRETLASRGPRPQKPRPELSPLEDQVFQVLEYEPLHFNDVVERACLSPTEASYALLKLTMKDLVKELEGKRYAKLP